MLSLLFILCFGDLKMGTAFQNPNTSDHIISDPYSMHFGTKGGLYVVDRYPAKIHQWNADGTYVRCFAGKGQGPGELNRPLKLTTHKDALWVWDSGQRFSQFDLNGVFLKSFALPGVEPRNFHCLDNGFVIAFKRYTPDNEMRRYFQLLDQRGQAGKVLQDLLSNHMLAPLEGTLKGKLKAYAPEADLQKDRQGNLWFGFSESATLHQLSPMGELLGKKTFSLPKSKPTSAEKELFENLSFPNPRDGGRIALKDIPTMKWDYSHDKAYYTQFLMLENRVVFVLTPLGSMNGGGHGFRSGSFSICAFESGELLETGRFNYPEDSMLLLRDGRALAIVSHEEGFQIHEVFF